MMTLEDCLESVDIFVTTTGNKDIIMAADMAKMKNNAIVGNIGHFDNEIDMAGLYAWQGEQRAEPLLPQLRAVSLLNMLGMCGPGHLL